MNYILTNYDFKKTISVLKKEKWLIHNFYDLKKEKKHANDILYDAYDFKRFIDENEDKKYVLIIDRNIFDYVIKSKERNTNHSKSAIHLILYCQYLNILIEPYLAIYEKYNYNKNLYCEMNEEYKTFQYIDNCKDNLYSYILQNKIIDINLTNLINIQNLPKSILEIKTLKHWNMFELGILKLTQIHFNDKINRKNKFNEYISYTKEKFITSIPLIVYAMLLFDKKTTKGIMKFKKNNPKRNDIVNMIWDVYNINEYYYKLDKKENNIEYIFASGDKLLNNILEICLQIAYGNLDYVIEFIEDKNIFNLFKDYFELRKKEKTSGINKPRLTKEFVENEKLILKRELNI